MHLQDTIAHLIETYGTPMGWQKASRCTVCGTTSPGVPPYDCAGCSGIGMTYSASLTVRSVFRQVAPRLKFTQAGFIEQQGGSTLLVRSNETLEQAYRKDYLKDAPGATVLRDRFTSPQGKVYLVKQPPKLIYYQDHVMAMRFEVEEEQA